VVAECAPLECAISERGGHRSERRRGANLGAGGVSRKAGSICRARVQAPIAGTRSCVNDLSVFKNRRLIKIRDHHRIRGFLSKSVKVDRCFKIGTDRFCQFSTKTTGFKNMVSISINLWGRIFLFSFSIRGEGKWPVTHEIMFVTSFRGLYHKFTTIYSLCPMFDFLTLILITVLFKMMLSSNFF
jgi:hypothetical protein